MTEPEKSERRTFIQRLIALGGTLFLPFCADPPKARGVAMPASIVKEIKPLSFPWETANPFLFCVHHLDRFPAGNGAFGPATSLAGRRLGNDFTIKDGFRMYHGETVPGFPSHPHRGFETVTVVTKGLVDHSDSLGGAGRYGNGDVQWMTAGGGIQHAEMFPLIHEDRPNTAELFQIWLNLPRRNKMVPPHYKMLWSEDIKTVARKDENGRSTSVTLVAGALDNQQSPSPPPDSWASQPDSDVRIWILQMEKGASFTIPASAAGLNRRLYFFEGKDLRVENTALPFYHSAVLEADKTQLVVNGEEPARLLLLQGRPIDEPVVQYGPFVMNSQEEIEQAFADYRKTSFGGWPWDRSDPVHGKDPTRFAKFTDGRIEKRSA